MLQYTLVLISCIYAAEASSCIFREFENGTVCVCNATYCDTIPVYETPSNGSYLRYTSSGDDVRLSRTLGDFTNETTSDGAVILLQRNVTYQSIQGFGGAFTDAATINIKSLSKAAQTNLLTSYFAKEGIRYNIGRVPVAGTDFSTRNYTYDDNDGDVSLGNFSLADEDFDYKIPLMLEALEINEELRFLASSWTAPPWMKTNADYVNGYLKEEYYQVYADYLIKFLDAYYDQGLEMWAITTGNEPNNGITSNCTITSMSMTMNETATWLASNFGPALTKSKHNKTLILSLDDQRSFLMTYLKDMFENELAKNYTDGVAIHWYDDKTTNASVLTEFHDSYPEPFLLMDEASVLIWAAVGELSLGSWSTGEKYINDIFENLENWVTGWMDWNIALNKDSEPNWTSGFRAQSPIIVNPDDDEFYKQPLFYAIAHFSRFIPRNSVRLELTQTNSSLRSLAFETPENETVIVVYNNQTLDQRVIIRDTEKGDIEVELIGGSIHTILYK
ncbi:lysosomal acid glucosylceramidase-like [Neodiprion virginianus]|uniref:lysosomal acid glucosylceramidase-like n=1 Tax=Neodiprion virginianus TaxID=2961670 RepID=UPI001EE70E56|nr:lysosomal acid glucosylceramidase-like [Neodiprion virginianus]XP_046610762.1 lysosomal acid glucosylceramidase-like [Neodiprion virginianus]